VHACGSPDAVSNKCWRDRRRVSHRLRSVSDMAPTPTNQQAAAPFHTSVIAAATSHEKAGVLEQLLEDHPELVEEAARLVSALLMFAPADAIADEVAAQLGSLGFEDLGGRAGRTPAGGYVHETDAAWEVLEEALEPFLTDMRRRSTLGFGESATSMASGIIAGIDRLRGAPDGQLIAFAGDDAIDTLTETVLDLADDLGIVTSEI